MIIYYIVMEKYVVDTCVAAKIFIDTEKYVDKAVALYDLAYDEKAELMAPSLIWYELGSVFSKMQMPREKSEENFAEFQEQIRMGIIKIIHLGHPRVNDDRAQTNYQQRSNNRDRR
ncbi:MAG: type II toxin-antitoxin system VapC family toxin [Pseudomonadota bacterium]